LKLEANLNHENSMNENSKIVIATASVVTFGSVLAVKREYRQSVTDGRGAYCPQIADPAVLSNNS
jgi:hypothetical protein